MSEYRPAPLGVSGVSTQQQRRTSLSMDDEIPALQSPSDSSESEDEPTPPQPRPATRQRTGPLHRPLANVFDSDDSDIDITESGTVLSFSDSRGW
jgi:hypothetical protein